MPKRLKVRELLKRLEDFGVIKHPKASRGKGSEVVVIRPTNPEHTQGPLFTITYHGAGTDVGEGLISACLRRFGIDKKDFFDGI